MKAAKEEITPDLDGARVRRRFRKLLSNGAEVRPAGEARHDPEGLLRRYPPRFVVDFHDVRFFLSGYRHDEALGFFVGYVVHLPQNGKPVRRVFPRIFYKDSSLLWRVASHYVHDEHEYWIGKGDVRTIDVGDDEYVVSVEATTNLPYEVQAAFDTCSRGVAKRRGDDAVELVLRQAATGRVEPFTDFTGPRRACRTSINRGRRVARLTRKNDPTSVKFVAGYEPDFRQGVAGLAHTNSVFFGGEIKKFRILSTNRQIQYMFFASPTHAWMNPPQALTKELSSFGVRLVDVEADDDLFVPGYEYHHVGEHDSDEDSQIPEGFAGEPHPLDPSRSDASRWLDALPVIQEFRRVLL